MNKLNQRTLFVMTIFIAIVAFSCGKREDVTQYAPIEHYPPDTTLLGMANKKAINIIAHDDDMCAMTGTISMLNKSG